VSDTARTRVQRAFRDHSQLLRRPARRLKRALSLVAFRVRSLAGRRLEPRVVVDERPASSEPIRAPAIAVRGRDRAALERFVAAQTETSVTLDPSGGAATFWLDAGGELGSLPATFLESLLLAATAESLEWVQGGWAPPAAGRFGPGADLHRDPGLAATASTLYRLAQPGRDAGSPVLGRSVPHVTAPERVGGMAPLVRSGVVASGPYHLREGVAAGAVVRHGWQPVDRALAALPEAPGPRTVLFLLPFLAVGGAERLLFDLLEGFAGRCRALVATVEPHLARLGQSVDRARALTPHVYTLGDWLPREAHHGAICHLVRRYRAETLVSWNGTTYFFDQVADLRRRFPRLRLASQLFNHEGGWIEHLSSALLRDVDLHLAVNDRIAGALVGRGALAERVSTIHHGVRVPPAPSPAERATRRRALRSRLGLPEDRVVVGTFIRLHPQKRPFDVLRVARRMVDRGVHFLLVGGGPLDGAVDAELRARPLPNLTRVPMCEETTGLYDAVDLCLLTSAYEGLPVFLLDGLARGIPCVATAVGEVPALLAEGGGVLVRRVGDVEALAAGVEALAASARRRLEGERGQATVRARFSHERYVEAYAAALLP
jgi:glycosyltransferase involved in cell wall biosynthesis